MSVMFYKDKTDFFFKNCSLSHYTHVAAGLIAVTLLNMTHSRAEEKARHEERGLILEWDFGVIQIVRCNCKAHTFDSFLYMA